MNARSATVSVTAPLTPAFERVKEVLFRPFDLGKWFVIGFCAWLAGLGERGGFHSGFNFNDHHRSGGSEIQHELERVRNYVTDNLGWIIPVGIAVFVVVIGIAVVFCWLNSRGKFMFLHCVARNRADVVEPWNRYSRESNSLFLFRLVLGAIGFVLVAPMLIFAAIPMVQMAMRNSWNAGGILQSVGIVLVLILIGIVIGIIKKFTMDFVVPIMFLRNRRCLEGWRELRGLMSGYLGEFVLYLLFQIVIGMVIAVMVIFAVLITCCIAGCLLALPYLGTVFLLPVLVFQRSYSLYFLAQFGRDYDAFLPPPGPEPIPPVA